MRFIQSKTFINLIILGAIFFVSILVRLDNLKDPLGRHHEWLTGHVLSTLSIYEKDGAASHYCAPVWTFSNEVDRFIVSSQEFKDKNNYTYYVSYPPLCFLLPHVTFKVLGTHASVLGIRIIGLATHFFIGFFVFLLLMKMFDKKLKEHIFLPAIMAFFFYTFAAGNLWFHGHVWFADMLVPLFITSFLYVVLCILKNEITLLKGSLFLFLTCFLGAYTEWQMLFVAFFVSVIFFLKIFRDRKYIIYFITICVATLLPVFITYVQYSSIAGSKALVEVITNKYKQRSGTDSNAAEVGMSMDNSFSFQNISLHYERNYSTLLDFGWYALLLFLFLALMNRMLEKGLIKLNHFIIFSVITASIFLHHYAFFNFTAVHDFSTLKSSLLVSLFCGYTIGLAFVLFDVASKKASRNWFVFLNILAIGLFFHFSTQSYYKVNQSSTIDKNPIVIGEIVHKYIKPTEAVFCTISTSPESTWYAKRSILTCSGVPDAAVALQRIDSKYDGQVIKLNATNFEVFKINTKGDTLGYISEDYGSLQCLKNM